MIREGEKPVSSTANPKRLQILLVEDNPGDVRLTQEVLIENGALLDLHVVENGVEAIEFLNRKDKYNDAPRPDLVLLDLNLPKKSGREVLSEIKANDVIKTIPVVVLTTSQAENDIVKAYGLHANCYITKPANLAEFIDVMKAIEYFWLKVVKLPSAR